ncbi:hypothetical protein [Nitrosomonas eutropha]|nr:hypothetical protein [Nitrosomonas eutropha]
MPVSPDNITAVNPVRMCGLDALLNIGFKRVEFTVTRHHLIVEIFFNRIA